MTKTIEEITEIVSRIEDEQQAWVAQADEQEDMWALKLWDGESDDERTYVTSPTPYNAVATARRMINTVSPNIECPALGFDSTSDENQEMKERWLKAMWVQIRKEMGENVISSAFWQLLVYGKGVMQALWVKESLPTKMLKNRLPFIIRTLDPRLCGFERGPLYMRYAFYKPTMTNASIKQQNPEFMYDEGEDDDEKDVIEFWWTDPESGTVWYSVLTADEFIVEPMETKYYAIPLVSLSGMYQPAKDEALRHLGLLYQLKGTWETTSDVMTMVMTSLLYDFMPSQPIVNEQGQAVNEEPMVPGEMRQFPAGTTFPSLTTSPNVGLADYALRQLGEDERESTFTGAANGQPLGSVQAGYSYNSAMAADESRIHEFLNNLQTGLSSINEIVLAMVDDMAGSKGITLQGRSASDGGRYVVALDSEVIGGNFQNEVRLHPVLERDEAARIAMDLRMIQDGVMSRRTMRDHSTKEFPADEQERITLEQVMNSEGVAPVIGLHTVQAYGSNNPATADLIKVLSAQRDGLIMQVEAQQQQMEQARQQMQQAQAQPGQAPGQPPSMSGGTLSPQQEGQISDSTFSAGQGDRPTPDQVSEFTG